MNAEQILGIPPLRFFNLFRNKATVETDFRSLAKIWHPDRCPDPNASTVFAHISELAQRARTHTGPWGVVKYPAFEIEPANGGKKILLSVQARFDSDFGFTTLSENRIILSSSLTYSKLMMKARETLRSLDYPSIPIQKEFAEYLPRSPELVSDKEYIHMIAGRHENLLRLADVMALGPIEPAHVAWIMSSLYNMACFLAFNRVKHPEISPDSYYIDPVRHVGALMGGWMYASRETLTHAPRRTLRLLPGVKNMKLDALHSAQIRQLGREMFGARTIGEMRSKTNVPKPMKDWLCTPGFARSAGEEFSLWDKCLEASFGRRRFVKWELTFSKLYEE